MNQKLFAFVLMPFDKTFDDIYQLGIKDACSELEIYCERVDEQIFTESILERVYNQIIKADIVIADMTGRNPNVFYETGFAHAFKKRVILLTQNTDDIPFDLKHYHHIVYGGSISGLKAELAKRLVWFKTNPLDASLPNIEDLQYYYHSKKLDENIELEINTRRAFVFNQFTEKYDFSFQLDIYNPNSKIVETKQQIAIQTPDFFSKNMNDSIKTIKLPSKKYLHVFDYTGKMIYPMMWDSVLFLFNGSKWDRDLFKEQFVLKIHDEVSIKEVNFTINLSPQ